ncbi:MAG: Rieske (2Fe-2S) protein [Gemmatimonadaceae bacterium]
MSAPDWHDLGPAEEFASATISPTQVGRVRLAVTHVSGQFGVVSGVCSHVGGPLGEGRLDGAYVVCPWHNWK